MRRRKTCKPRQSGQQENNRSRNSQVQEPLQRGYSAMFYRRALDLCCLVFNTKIWLLCHLGQFTHFSIFSSKNMSQNTYYIRLLQYNTFWRKCHVNKTKEKGGLPEWIWLITSNAAERSKNWNTLEIVIKKLYLISKRAILAEGWGLK